MIKFCFLFLNSLSFFFLDSALLHPWTQTLWVTHPKTCSHLFPIWLEFLLKKEVRASKKSLNMYLRESTHLFLSTIFYSFNLTQVSGQPPTTTSTIPILKKELSLKLTSVKKEMGRLLKAVIIVKASSCWFSSQPFKVGRVKPPSTTILLMDWGRRSLSQTELAPSNFLFLYVNNCLLIYNNPRGVQVTCLF